VPVGDAVDREEEGGGADVGEGASVGEKRKSNSSCHSGSNKSYKMVKHEQLKAFDGKLMMHQKKCAYQECKDCGVVKRLKLTCPSDNDDTVKFPVRLYAKVDRPTPKNSKDKTPRFQVELKEVLMTGREIMQMLVQAAIVSIKHAWQAKWDSHQRKLLIHTLKNNMLLLMTDFSATYSIHPQFQVNSAVAAHVIIDVFLAYHSPRDVALENGQVKRVLTVDVFYFLAETSNKADAKLKNDNFFHVKAQQWILNHYRTRNTPLTFETVITWSDGCSPQYKCIKNMYALTESAQIEDDVEHMFHIFAITGCFKTPVDGAGTCNSTLYTHNTHNIYPPSIMSRK
jgi:hypothetical protein